MKRHVEHQSQHSLFLIDLPHSPAQAMAMVESHIAELDEQDWGVIGSSLGGFYTTYLCAKYDKRGVLINPAVRAHQLLEATLGENKNYHSAETFIFTREHLEQLQALYLPRLEKPENLLLLTQTADEVLDYQQGIDYYQGSEQLVIEGGSHGFDDYENYLDKTFNFLTGQHDD
ncbi:MAG: YqiA/YcfP family alpha/beta fold hydrolase [Cycloclasticus sp.]